MSSENRIHHPIRVTQPYYVTRVSRTLEIRVEATHEVVEVIEPPAEWGDKWLWSYIGFDGVRCVPMDAVSLIRLDVRPLTVTGNAASQPHDEPWFVRESFRPSLPGDHQPLSSADRREQESGLSLRSCRAPAPSHLPPRRITTATVC